MRWVLAIVLAMSSLACSGPPGQTYTTVPKPDATLSLMPSLQAVLRVSGRVSVAELIYQLRKQEVLRRLPPSGMLQAKSFSEYIQSDGNTRICDAIKAIEEACGWVFNPHQGDFYIARATHSVDQPDAFGRPGAEDRAPMDPRPMVQVSFRFRRVSIGANNDVASIGGDGTVFCASLPDGIQEEWSKTSERSYFEELRDANNPNVDSSVVRTTRKVVESGIDVRALAARLPGGLFRLDGRISLSSFQGQNLDRAVIDFPLQCDGQRGQWCRVVVIKGADLGASVAFRQFGIGVAGSGEALELSVMVD